MGGDGDIRRDHDPALRDQIVERAEAAGLRLVRFLYCDNDGLIRGKATGMAGLARRLETGIGLTVAMQAFSLLDQLWRAWARGGRSAWFPTRRPSSSPRPPSRPASCW